MIHKTIKFYSDLWRATSHIKHLLKRASSLNSRSCLPIFQIIHSYANMIHITIMFLCDLRRFTSHIQHLLKRVSSLNTHSRSLMWFLSHCGILLKQLIVSVMTKYWISWLSRKTHLKYTTKQQKTNKNFKGRVEWMGQHNVLRTPCCSLCSRNEKRQINMCMYISLQPGY